MTSFFISGKIKIVFLSDIVTVSKRVSETKRKKEKIFLISNFLKNCRGEEISIASSYLSGEISARSLGIGWAILERVIRNSILNPRPINLIELDRFFNEISNLSGKGSLEKKIKLLQILFSSINDEERRFLIGLITGELRQGVLEGIVLEAIADASNIPLQLIRQAFMFSSDIGEVARVALEEGIQGLSRFKPRLFHPIAPMLANTAEKEEDPLIRWGKVACEFKIDGARIQIHKEREDVRVFTRNLKEVTESIPEIIELARGLPLNQAIFEGEIFAIKPDGRPMPFQITMRRFGRIQDVENLKKEIPLSSYFFDLLYIDGESLLNEPYQKRFQILSKYIPKKYVIPRIIATEKNDILEFIKKSLTEGNEGIMAKSIDSPYVAGHRGYYWLKIKPAKTLDLVVLGAEWGHGRRKGYLSNLHLGARDPESGKFIMLGKTFKGITDQMLKWQTEKLLSIEIDRDERTVYVEPKLVVEIAFDSLQKSPRYPGGLALRFARVKNYREDKSPHDADTIQKVREIFESTQK